MLVLGGGTGEISSPVSPLLALAPEEHVAYYEKQGMARMDAIKAAAKERGIPKNELYRILHQEKL